MPFRTERIAAIVIIAASFLLFTIYSVATPLFEASDELWHYPLVQHLATGGGLPVQRKDQTDADAPWRQEGSQPPLYYWLAAAASAPLDSSNWREIRRINPHSDMGVPTRDGNSNAILHTPEEAWPWTRAALAVHVARLVSILMSTATVACAYLVARELFRDEGPGTTTRSRSLAPLRLAIPVLVATVPMFAFISGAINNDNAAVLLSTLGLWWALRAMRMGDLSTRSALVAGLIAGFGALSKSSALGLVALFGVAALLSQGSEMRRRTGWIGVVRFTLIVALVTLVVSGWWFVRNQQLYGDPLGWNAFLDVVGRRDKPATLAQLWSEREGFVWAYWGIFGTLNVIMTPWIYFGLDLLFLLAAVSCVVVATRRLIAIASQQVIFDPARNNLVDPNTETRGQHDNAKRAAAGLKVPPRESVLSRPALLCVFWLALVFIALVRWTALTPASQGRLMFPCIAVTASLMAYGLWRIHWAVLATGCLAMSALALAVPFAFIAPAYAVPANTWTSRLSMPIDMTFGGALQLVEAGDSPHQTQPGGVITLNVNWRLRQAVGVNYSVFVHLIDENDVIVAQRDMYPGQGNLALSEQPIGRMWSDHYTLRIPALAPAPKVLRWALGVYDYRSGARLKLPGGADRAIFGAVMLVPSQSATPQARAALLHFANGVELLGYSLVPTTTLAPGQTVTVTSRWRATQPVAKDLKLSLQLLDDNAGKVAQQDPSQALTTWRAGDVIEVTHTLTIDAKAAPNTYRLLLVWYDPDGFARLGAYDAHGVFAGDQIELTRVRVR